MTRTVVSNRCRWTHGCFPCQKPRRRPSHTPVNVAPTKIDVSRMNFYYGAHRVLEQINVKVMPNEVTALIGPSGCGKSTFLRSLNRMNDIIPGTRVEGSVLIDGQDIYAPVGRHRQFAAARRDGVSEVQPVSEVDLR